MILTAYFFLFIFGSALGSFLNVIIDRVPRRESFLTGRSHCEHCRHKLFWYDLIPVFSYVSLNGQCRYCKKTLSIYYPVIEIVTGLSLVFLFASIYVPDIMVRLQDARYLFAAFYLWIVISSLIVIFFIDLKYGIIPFSIVCFLLLLSLLWQFLSPTLHFSVSEVSHLVNKTGFANHFLSAVGAFASFLFLFLITRGRGLGFGDVVYVFFMGFLLGFPEIVIGLYIAFLSGAFVSFILVLLGKKKFSGGSIPFGPFLVTGTIVTIFWGDIIKETVLIFLQSR